MFGGVFSCLERFPCLERVSLFGKAFPCLERLFSCLERVFLVWKGFSLFGKVFFLVWKGFFPCLEVSHHANPKPPSKFPRKPRPSATLFHVER